MTFLCYGIDANNNFVYIDEIRRGKTDLKCPYCGGLLTAKKGQKKGHHFAHTEDTCQYVGMLSLPNLPLFDRFTLHLTQKEFFQMKSYREGRRFSKDVLSTLEKKGFIKYGTGFCGLTKLGKIVFGELSLPLFAEIQDELIFNRLLELEKRAESAWNQQSIDFPDFLTDFKLYKAQFQRVLKETFYFLGIDLDGKEYYKVGTINPSTSLQVVIDDIKKKMKRHYSSVTIEILGEWENRGSLKPYFYHRNSIFKSKELGISGVFDFSSISPEKLDPNKAKKVVREMKRIPLKYIEPQEQKIIDGELFEIETKANKPKEITQKEKFSAAVIEGMEKAKLEGIHVGRPLGQTESTKTFLDKPKNKAIAFVLKKGLSIRQTAKKAGVSINTVRKVKAALESGSIVKL